MFSFFEKLNFVFTIFTWLWNTKIQEEGALLTTQEGINIGFRGTGITERE
jgi:hypothetical protein